MTVSSGINNKSIFISIVIFLVIFTLLFLSFPINNSLVTDCDSWYYIAKYNYFFNCIKSLLGGEEVGQYFFPANFPTLNGEPSFGIFPLWLMLKIIIGNDLWVFFFLLVSIYTLNSTSLFILIHHYKKDISFTVAICSGLFFSLNMFMFANQDNINTLFIAPGILSIFYFYKLINNNGVSNERKNYTLFGLFLVLQLTASVYNFLYILLFLFSVIIIYRKKFFLSLSTYKSRWILLSIIGILLCATYIYLIVVFPDKKSTHWNFSNNLGVVKIFSLTMDDFFRVLSHTLYSKGENESQILNYQSLFSGFTFILLVLSGFYSSKLKFKEIYLVIFLSVVIGIGTYIQINGKVFLMPLGLLYENMNAYSYFRFPFRIFLLIVLMLSILATLGLDFIVNRLKNRWIIVFFLLAFVIENIPFKRAYNDFNLYFNEGKYIKTLLTESDQNILFLPAGDLMYRSGMMPRMNETAYIFMYWQTIIKRNVINGNGGFLPPHIVELNDAIYKSDTPLESLLKFCLKYNVDMVIQYGDGWNFDTFPLNSSLIEEGCNDLGIKYVFR